MSEIELIGDVHFKHSFSLHDRLRVLFLPEVKIECLNAKVVLKGWRVKNGKYRSNCRKTK